MPYSIKRFRFRLQALLNIEKNREKQAQIAFQKAMNALRRQEAILEQQEQEYRRGQEAMAKDIQRRATPQALSSYDIYFNGLKRWMEDQRRCIAEAEKAVEAARKELAERTKKRKILDKLRERKKGEHDEESRKVEVSMMDEIGSSMTIRKMAE
jgi:flagellar FliJ protein